MVKYGNYIQQCACTKRVHQYATLVGQVKFHYSGMEIRGLLNGSSQPLENKTH